MSCEAVISASFESAPPLPNGDEKTYIHSTTKSTLLLHMIHGARHIHSPLASSRIAQIYVETILHQPLLPSVAHRGAARCMIQDPTQSIIPMTFHPT